MTDNLFLPHPCNLVEARDGEVDFSETETTIRTVPLEI